MAYRLLRKGYPFDVYDGPCIPPRKTPSSLCTQGVHISKHWALTATATEQLGRSPFDSSAGIFSSVSNIGLWWYHLMILFQYQDCASLSRESWYCEDPGFLSMFSCGLAVASRDDSEGIWQKTHWICIKYVLTAWIWDVPKTRRRDMTRPWKSNDPQRLPILQFLLNQTCSAPWVTNCAMTIPYFRFSNRSLSHTYLTNYECPRKATLQAPYSAEAVQRHHHWMIDR